MAITLVQQKIATFTGSATTASATFTSDTTTGNTIIAAALLVDSNLSSYIKSVTDGTNTYTPGPITYKDEAGTSNTAILSYANNITGATTPTVTANFSASNTSGIAILEVSGLAPNQPLDYMVATYMTKNGFGKYGLDTPAPKTANNLVFMFVNAGGTITFTAGAGFSNLQSSSNATNPGSIATQIQINSASAPLSSLITENQFSESSVVMLGVFSDTDLPAPRGLNNFNNYQSVRVSSGMSASERIR